MIITDNPHWANRLNRRIFLGGGLAGILGSTAVGGLRAEGNGGNGSSPDAPWINPGVPKAKRIIYLFQSGAPSQMDLFDPKPVMEKHRGKDLPESIRKGQRLTTMTSGQSNFPIAPSVFQFKQHGKSGLWLSDAWKHLPKVADEICMIKTVNTEAINHDPAITFMQTGNQLPGRPSIGAWVSYGLGSPNRDLPAYVVLTSFGSGRPDDQPLYDRLWSAGFLPGKHQGVKFRNKGDAVLYLTDPPGVDRATRRATLDRLSSLNGIHHQNLGDPEIETRVSQYEMAFRMQSSVPDLLNVKSESKETLDLYGPDVTRPGSYAANCLLARRLAERDVRFIQLFHMGWDHHGNLPGALRGQCKDTDQATTALLIDLKRRGLLEDTLVVWGGEFGRTIYSQGGLSVDNYGRDHHPRCFSMFMAGAGVKKGMTFGETDEYCYNIVKDPVHVNQLNATILHLLGINHERLTFTHQGLEARLTGVETARVVTEVLA
jgi:hypothetical protein